MTNPNRVRPGVPTGGQFAPSTHSEGAVALAPAAGGFYRDRLASDWENFTGARDTMAQSALESLAASVERDYPAGSSVFVTVDDAKPSWMKVIGVRLPDGSRVDDGEFMDWKYNDETDISPIEAAEYLPADESPWWDAAIRVPDDEALDPGINEWHLDIAKIQEKAPRTNADASNGLRLM